ncbi:MAG: GAF domain-containing protein, partial [Candidatus Bathyanammoxibius sp.]
EGIRSRMAYPLTYRGEVIGAMNFGSKKPGNYSEENFILLSQIAPQMVVVLENARLIEKEKQRPEGGG